MITTLVVELSGGGDVVDEEAVQVEGEDEVVAGGDDNPGGEDGTGGNPSPSPTGDGTEETGDDDPPGGADGKP